VTLGALFYLDSRQIVNRLRTAFRAPGRILIYIVAFGYFIAMAFLRARRGWSVPTVPDPYASAIFYAFIALIGIVAYGAASGILGAFSSDVDARFLIGSRLDDRLVVLWLQLRRSASSMGRMVFTLVLYTFFVSQSGGLAGVAGSVLGGTLIAVAISIPALKLHSVAGSRIAQAAAGAVTAIGLFPLLIVLSGIVSPNATSAGVLRLHAGAVTDALSRGDWRAIAILYAVAAFFLALSWACGADLYPDLYGASLRAIAYRAQQRRGPGAAFDSERSYTNRRTAAVFQRLFDRMGGPWAIVWKEWMAFLRSPGMQRSFWFGLFACAAVGWVFGTIAVQSRDPLGQSIVLASMAGNVLVIFVAMGSAIGLAADLRKPLWWIGRDALWSRLAAWTLGTSWRLAACVSAGLLAWAGAMRFPMLALFGVPLAITGVVYLRAVGLAIYSLFPSTLDQRGPLAMFRALLTFILAGPPAVAGVVLSFLTRNLMLSFAVTLACACVESALLVAFASARIDGRGAGVAAAESM
jgi:hypothetical protein